MTSFNRLRFYCRFRQCSGLGIAFCVIKTPILPLDFDMTTGDRVTLKRYRHTFSIKLIRDIAKTTVIASLDLSTIHTDRHARRCPNSTNMNFKFYNRQIFFNRPNPVFHYHDLQFPLHLNANTHPVAVNVLTHCKMGFEARRSV